MSLGSSSAAFFGAAGAAGAGEASIEIERSLRFNSADSAYLNRTPSSAGNRKTWTWSGWVKLAGGASTGYIFGNYADGSNYSGLNITAASTGYFRFYDFISGSANASITWSPQFRDFSAWYHLILVVDTTQSTSTDRIKFYVNGVLQPTLTASYPAQNADLRTNQTIQHNIGALQNTPSNLFDGYLADVHFIDGQALDPTDFGEFDDNNVWQPIAYSGSYGTNGFHLLFDNTSNLGEDSAGSNDWTANNFSTTAGAGNDSLFDSPTNGTQTDTGAGGEVSGNYATMSPNIGKVDYTLASLSNGNLQVDWVASRVAWSDFGLTSGKWYYETTMLSGVSSSLGNLVRVGRRFSTSYNAFLWRSNGATSGLTGNPTFSTYATGDVLGIAIDVDNEQATFYKNGTVQGTGAYSYTSANGEPIFVGGYSNYTSASSAFNFGQRPYTYQNVGVDRPSAEYKSFCTANLTDPTIVDGSAAMDVVLYNGTGGTQSISGLNFSPNLVWTKNKGATASHAVYDSARIAGNLIRTNETTEEVNVPARFISFDTNGYTIGSTSTENNASSNSYVAWVWNAGTPPTRTHTQPAYYSSTTLYTSAADVVANATPRSGGDVITAEYVYIVTNSGGGVGQAVFSDNGSLGTPWYMLLYDGGAWTYYGSYNSTDPADFRWRQDFVPSQSTFTCANNVELHLISNSTSPAVISRTLPSLSTTYDDGAVVNTDGSTESRVVANPSAGFSIVNWTALAWTGSPQSVGHGLGVAPAFIITKGRENAASWYCYHKDTDATNPEDWYLTLNNKNARGTLADSWGTTPPDATTFGDRQLGWTQNQDVVAYCFCSVEGYSAFGTYTATALSDGPFIYTGFRPKWVLIKSNSNSSSYTSWGIFDSEREPINADYDALFSNLNTSEGYRGDGSTTASLTQMSIDKLSNGFKIRNNGNEFNPVSGYTYVYAAFAENPFKYARAR